MQNPTITLPLGILVLAAGLLPAWSEPLSYNRDIRPILSENCFFCHGFDKESREGGLRLDTFEAATTAIEGRFPIKPGDPEASSVVSRIHATDSDDLMPPSDSNRQLTEGERLKLTQWIREGAPYEEHWSFKTLARPTPPSDVGSPVDAFLQRTWRDKGVEAVAPADPRSLLRRLSFDLRGLAPTIEEVEAFEADPSKAHFDSFVDRWIESTEYAEHQGLLWLDLVRWADSSGMVSDEPIASGPYRRYVVQAFRDNMPFDQFTREQLAGDLLPEKNDRTLTASAYNRLVKTNSEAGVIEAEALHALKGEHTRAVGTVWLGLTTGCAECHDHKYDPITAKDYYSLAAFFDDLIEAGVYDPGDRRVPLHYLYEQASKVESEARLSGQIEKLRREIYGAPVDSAALERWKKETLARSRSIKKEKGVVDYLWMPAQLPPAQVVSGEFEQTPEGRRVHGPLGELTRHLAGETIRGVIEGRNEGIYTHVTIEPKDAPSLIALQTINGAYWRLGWHRSYHATYYWGEEDDPLLKQSLPWLESSKLIHMGPVPAVGELIRLEVPKKSLAKGEFATVGLAWIQAGGTVTWGDSGYRTDPHRVFTNKLGESSFRYWWELPLNRDDRKLFPTLVDLSLRRAPDQTRQVHRDAIRHAYQESSSPDLVERLNVLYREIFELRQDALPTLVSRSAEPKQTRLVARGDFMDASGPVVEPATPGFFTRPEQIPKGRATRLDLANWIMSPDNPLTARVVVNRLWNQFYGRGLSETLDDSGNQGGWPSHPDLIDWLACELRDEGWDIRHVIRLLVSSEAYRLSSVPNPLLAEEDPDNRLHARQGRERHTAEEIRDNALLAAGLLKLTNKIPAKSFYPYQPESYWKKSNKVMYGSRYQIWDTDSDPHQYSRSLYTFWKRQNIHPSLLAFDAPTRQECTAKRSTTNSPAQALALLNDPIFVEAARGLAQRVLVEASTATRLRRAYRHALQRDPAEQEIAALSKLLEQMKSHFAANPEEAEAFLGIGQFDRSIAGVPPEELAAWSAVCRAILNLHEFVTRS